MYQYVYSILFFYSDEEPADEEDDDFEADDEDPDWEEDGDLGEGSGGRGRSPIRRRADSPMVLLAIGEGAVGAGAVGPGAVGPGAVGPGAVGPGAVGLGVVGLWIPGPTLVVVNLMMMWTLGIPSLPFNQAVRQELTLIDMSCGEE